MASLTVQSDALPSKKYTLEKPEITIGRLEDNDIVLEHGSVSGHHAILIKQGEDYLIKDRNSTNGTAVNGTKITEHLLRSGDIIHFGYIQVEYTSESASTPLPDPTSGRDFSFATHSSLPTNFKNLSPFGGKREESTSKPLDYAIWVLAVLCGFALAAAVLRFFA